ncbi:MAG: DNA mismatch repair protein MutS [Bacteroidota bacterium]
MEPLKQFQQRQQQFEQQAQKYQLKYNQFGWLRVFLFLTGFLGTYFLFQSQGALAMAVGGLLFLLAFLFSLKAHNRIEYQRDHFRFLSYINRDESARLHNEFIRDETGEAYTEPNHFYTSDLDIFGKHSVFKLLNRTRTLGGAQKLAAWLKHAETAPEIRLRQEAVTELTPRLDWRQMLEANAMHYKEVNQSTHSLLQWMAEPEIVSQSFGMRLAKWLPMITIPLTVAWLAGFLSLQVLFLFILVHLFVLGRIFKAVKDTCDKTNTISQTLMAYANIIKVVEKEKFTAAKLQALQHAFVDKHTTASKAIQQFAIILRNLNYRNNPYFYSLIGIISLWDLQFFIRTEQWKKQHQQALINWFEAVAEWESLNSLAGYAFSNPEFIMPILSPEPMELQAEHLGHVLIRKDKRVTNHVQLSGLGKTLVITGSNMSGKSTFLRTVAVNAVLALAGAPVCAKSFTISVIRVFTSMRTQDSLEESVSSFYAELKRLKQLIEQVDNPEPVLYFLDEILKGTNSQDRHHGAKSLIKQLHQHPSSGFISTHDLELGRMADEHPDFVHNYSFNSELINEELFFDYTLREGICRSFNASQLMKQIGIEV